MPDSWQPIDFKSARVHARLRVEDAAKGIGISTRMLLYFEAGRRNLKPEKRQALLEFILRKEQEHE